MMRPATCLVLAALLAATGPGHADDAPPPAGANPDAAPPQTVAEIKAAHDLALVRDLERYVDRNPKADDLDQAYVTLFDKAIEHDWFAEQRARARHYLSAYPEGAVRPLAQIVVTMASAHDGRFAEALQSYRALMLGLNGEGQEEFAVNFADSLASAATGAGEYDVARQVYQILLEKFGQNEKLRAKVHDDLDRIAMVGRPAPTIAVKDLDDKPFRLADLKGKYVLVDFWATWCAPCVAELPTVQAAHAKYRAKGLEIVGISLDETPDAAREFVRDRKLPWRQLHNATCGADLQAAYGVGAIPATFLIDPEGKIIRLELRGPALEKALQKALK